MVTKGELRERVRLLEKELRELRMERDGYKSVVDHYSSLSDSFDNGQFARAVYQDVQKRIKDKNYKPINYTIAKIIRETEKSYPIYIEGLFNEYQEDFED